MWLGLSHYIAQAIEPSRIFSYIYDNPKCFTYKMEQVPFSLRSSEKKACATLTRRFAEHLIMVMYPQVQHSVENNRHDCVEIFLEKIYNTCIEHNAVVSDGMVIGSNEHRFIQLTKDQLKRNHHYTREFNEYSVISCLRLIIIKLDVLSSKKTEWDSESVYKIFDESIKETKTA